MRREVRPPPYQIGAQIKVDSIFLPPLFDRFGEKFFVLHRQTDLREVVFIVRHKSIGRVQIPCPGRILVMEKKTEELTQTNKIS